eukprot:418720_1
MAEPEAGKNFDVLKKYFSMEQGAKVQCEYIWIGSNGLNLRSKTRTLNKRCIRSLEEIPMWNYDGSSTGQAEGHYSEILLEPKKFISDPFRRGNNIMCLCECLDAKSMSAIATNTRADAALIFSKEEVCNLEPWYGIEQEYTLMYIDCRTPLGWKNGFPSAQGPYYCGVGANVSYGRHVAEAHYRACLFAGLDISGINAEVMPGQWEFQVGPCIGIDSGDQLMLARYLLQRVAEDFNVVVSFDPKPVKGDWNGAGAHCNYSTKLMREKGGYKYIIQAVERLGKVHEIHMKMYGKNNRDRLTGMHETAKFAEFKYGVANRGASIRIPRQCEIDQKGYLEDRRPAANCDPYIVTSMIAKTTILQQKYNKPQLMRQKTM